MDISVVHMQVFMSVCACAWGYVQSMIMYILCRQISVYVQMYVCVCITEASPQAKTIMNCLHKHPDQRVFLLPNWP